MIAGSVLISNSGLSAPVDAQFTGAMEAATNLLDLLPVHMRDIFLGQAFQLLDQHHLFSVLPLVCHLWQQVALSNCNNLNTTIATAAAGEHLNLWMQKHGHSLDHLSLAIEHRVADTEAVQQLVTSLGQAVQLCSLRLCITNPLTRSHLPEVNVSLSPLTHLTRLSFSDCRLSPATMASLLPLSQLKSLQLTHTFSSSVRNDFLPSFSSSCQQLTSLDLSRSGDWVRPAQLTALRALPHLQELRVEEIAIPAAVLTGLQQLPFTAVRIQVKPVDVPVAAAWLSANACKLEVVKLHEYIDVLEVEEVALLLAALKPPQAARLRHLDLSFMNLDPGAGHLTSLTQLTSLMLLSKNLGDAALNQLSALSGLKSLGLQMNRGITGGDGSMERLAACLTQLARLGLRGTSAVEAAQQAFSGRIQQQRNDMFTLRPLEGL